MDVHRSVGHPVTHARTRAHAHASAWRATRTNMHRRNIDKAYWFDIDLLSHATPAWSRAHTRLHKHATRRRRRTCTHHTSHVTWHHTIPRNTDARVYNKYKKTTSSNYQISQIVPIFVLNNFVHVVIVSLPYELRRNMTFMSKSKAL